MQPTTVEKGYQKYAWVLLFILGLVGILFGLLQLAGVQVDAAGFTNQVGQSPSSFASSSPKAWSALVTSTQYGGTWLLGFGIFGTAISYTAYRRGEKWAWYVELFLPVSLVIALALNYTTAGTFWPLFVALLVIDLAGLFLPYRKFFPK